MKIWLIKDGEPVPLGDDSDRLFRIGILANTLIKLDHQVTWWTSDFNHHKKTFRNTERSSDKYSKNLRINQIKSPGYKRNISVKRVLHNFIVATRFKRLANQTDKPDVILCCLPTVELAYHAVQYGKLHNVPVIVDLRDMWPDIFLYSVPSKIRWLVRIIFNYQFMQMRYVCVNATNLVGVSEGFLQWGLEYARRGRNINDRVFPLGYVDMFSDKNLMIKTEKNNIQERIGYTKNDFIIVYVGSLTSKINFQPIIDAVVKIGPTVKLVIAGLGDTYEYLVQTCQNLKNVKITGWLDKKEIFALLSIATIGLYPYPNRKDFKDHFPNKFIEYLCSSLPVLSKVTAAAFFCHR